MEPRIRVLADDLADELFANGSPADIVERYARIDFLRMISGLLRMRRYLEERLQHARMHGGEGLIAELVRVEMEGGRISRNEMVSWSSYCWARGRKRRPI